MKIWIAVFYKDSKLTGGWMELTAETESTIEAWCAHPGCTVKFTTTERIE